MSAYKEACEDLLNYGSESAPRGIKVLELLNHTLEFYPGEHQVVHELLPNNLNYIMREIEWYIKADPCDLTIVEAAPIWKEHVQDGRLESNYGFWLKRTLPYAIHALANEVDTRRAVAYIGNESSFLPGRRDVPCTNMIQYIIRDEMLYVTVTMRSQDVFYGLRNDLAAFQFFAETVASIFGTPLEKLVINVGSFHVYEDKIAIIDQLVESKDEPTYHTINFHPLIDRIRTEWNL